MLQMPVPDPGAVEAELFSQGDDLESVLVPGARIGRVEQANGQEPELVQRYTRKWHVQVLPADRNTDEGINC